MKRILIICTALISITVTAHARDHKHYDLRGVILGAGGGALLGQALGRNTQSTVIGSAVGGVVGYLVGTEMDRGRTFSYPRSHSHYDRPRHHRYEPTVQYHEPLPRRNDVTREHYAPCRQTEILATIDGKPKKIYGTVCKTARGWELEPGYGESHPTTYHLEPWQEPYGDYDLHPSSSRHSRWVHNRF